MAGDGDGDICESLLSSIGVSSLEGREFWSAGVLDVRACTNSSSTLLSAKRTSRLSGFPKGMVDMTGRVESSSAVSNLCQRMFPIDVFVKINTLLVCRVFDPLNTKRQCLVRILQYQRAKLVRMGAFDALLC